MLSTDDAAKISNTTIYLSILLKTYLDNNVYSKT